MWPFGGTVDILTQITPALLGARSASKTGHNFLNGLNVATFGMRHCHWWFKQGKTKSHWFTPDISHLGTVVFIETHSSIAQKLQPAVSGGWHWRSAIWLGWDFWGLDFVEVASENSCKFMSCHAMFN